MSKKDDFIAVVKRVKSTLSTITDEQRRKLLRQGVQDCTDWSEMTRRKS